ncbi:ABC transporter ATP-binding protein [Curtobacterium sp. Leaf261]|uniref:ABC transporter ATP-binding protein n=1 Tax=Curtobacterium sp. Leaf261 TaxID=1736311 RepID=UPI0006FFFB09|nr:ABC transporter ATP-binding protein [Curtobacterium sp. Leaf261]KQO65182.1 ABC transporter [Curtobacterium sp. Leaf261]
MPTAPAVEVHHLRKHYGPKHAIEDVSFTITQGETFALLGPNGAGKSTTVEILEGYRDRTAGEVSVLGQDPQHANRELKQRIGIVLQTATDAGNFTVIEQLRHFAKLYPNSKDPDQVLDAVGLTQQASQRISRLSGGQRRRVDVALGVIGNPEVLFLDEPTTGFDPEARRQFWDLIKQQQADGTTVLLTTHYLDEAAHLADRAAVIANGRVLAEGTTAELGGAEARTPIVRWTDGRDQNGGPTQREERATDPARLVARLQAELGTVHDLEVIRPSLEDVYLDLIKQSQTTPSQTTPIQEQTA